MRFTVNSIIRPLAGLVLGFIITTGSQAQLLVDLESGAVFPGRYNRIQVAPDQAGTRFDAFGPDFKTNPRVNFRLRVGYTLNDRHTFSLLYAPLQIESNSRQPLTRPLRFQEATFDVGQPLRVRYQFSGYRFTYRYSFLRTDKLRAGVGLTLNVRDAYIKLDNGRQSDQDVNQGLVPLLNVYLNWRPTGGLGLLVEGDGFAVNQGRAIDVFAGLNYHLTPTVAIKGGYRVLEGEAVGKDGNSDLFNQFWANFASIGLTIGL